MAGRHFHTIALWIPMLLGGCLNPESPVRPPERGGGLSFALATVPPDFKSVIVTNQIATATAMAVAPDGRLFVCEKSGKLRVVRRDTLLPAPFLSVNVDADGERGLLGTAFDPDFASNGYVYVYYTVPSPLHNRVSRFTSSSANPDVAAAGSETVILDLDNLSFASNHNGGAIHFGPDGKLYVAVGDNANGENSLTLSNLLGKMLRINKDGSVPADNPFYASASGNNRAIWALGLRNPFTFSFQPGTGRMFINDVGQNAWEEINDGRAGAHYGWPRTEGPTADPNYAGPFHAYDHSGGSCAIVGSAFYNPAAAQFPSGYLGDYFFADYCAGWIKSLDVSSKTVTTFATGVEYPVDVQVSADGSLYYLTGVRTLHKVTYSGSQAIPPSITQHPSSITVTAGASAAFSVAAAGTAPLAYQWQRNGSPIAGAVSASYTLAPAQSADSGAGFRCVVSNAQGSAVSNEAVLTVTSNRAPTAEIAAPAPGALYQGGQVIAFSGSGTDPEDGSLPASSFTWQVDFHHETHVHPFLQPAAGSASGSFTIPVVGETSSDVRYRVYLTVKDKEGLVHRVYRDVLPLKAEITLATNPPGLRLRLDGQPVTSPYVFTGVVGMVRGIEAVTPQSSGGIGREFLSWSDGGAAAHSIATPSSAATFTAAYREIAAAPYEAEQALLSGSVVRNRYAGYTGTGYADYLHAYYDYVEWTVYAASAGTRTLEFRYAHGGGNTRPLRISVNGVTVRSSFGFPGTGSQTTWRTVSLDASLAAGANKVRATAIGRSGPNMDHLRVR